MKKIFWKNKKVLITGFEGFLGSNLTKTLIANGACIIGVDKIKNRPVSVLNGFRKNIVSIKGDMSDLKFIKNIINKYKPQVIFNLAAEAIVGECNKDPIKTFKSNIQGTWNVLEASRDRKFIEAIISASSDKAYGSHEVLPYKEDASLKGAHPYDVSKSCADLICYTYWNTYKTPVCVTRCGNIYGPGDFNFSRLIPDAVRSLVLNKTLKIRSDGNFVRDYIYVGDIVTGYIRIAELFKKRKLSGEAFNLSNEKPITVIKLLKEMNKLDLCGGKLNYKVMDIAKYEIREQYLSSAKARSILGWKPVYNLKEGLKKTIEWYRGYL